jgi:membrane protease YdiL (CAAX protease family)
VSDHTTREITPTATRARAETHWRHSHRIGIAAFLVLAFGLAWLPFLPAVVGNEPVGTFVMPLAPAVACVVVRTRITREGFGDAGLHPSFRHWRIYLLAVTWPIPVVVVSVIVATMLRTAPRGSTLPWGLGHPSPARVVELLALSVAVAPIFLGEELGWRGYLQMRLFDGRLLPAAVATGLIWGVWHYPMVLTGGQPTQSIAQTLLLLPISTTAMSVLLGWMRVRTGSLWPGTAAHAANNVTSVALTSLAFTGDPAGTLPSSASVPVVVAEVVVLGLIVVVGSRSRGRAR